MTEELKRIVLALTISLNLTQDSELLKEQLILGENVTEQQTDIPQYEGYALVLKDNIPMYASLNLKEEVCTLDKGTLVFCEDKDTAYYVHNNEVGGFVEKQNVTTQDIYNCALNMGLKQVIKPECDVDLYTGPNYEGEILCEVTSEDSLAYEGSAGDFYEVSVNKKIGYIENRYARKTFNFTPIVMEEDSEDDYNADLYNVKISKQQAKELLENAITEENMNSPGVHVARNAIKYVGNKYVWGGNSLNNGVDCSGFVRELYFQEGISLPRVSRYQAQINCGISEQELQPGDLVFYDKGGVVNHVALYLGNGYIIHASNKAPYPKGGIKVSKMKYRQPYKYVRAGG